MTPLGDTDELRPYIQHIDIVSFIEPVLRFLIFTKKRCYPKATSSTIITKKPPMAPIVPP